MVIDFNVGMKGVDMTDQLVQSYLTSCKSIKWTTKVLYELIEMTVINSFLVHKALGGNLTQWAFTKGPVCELLQEFHQSSRVESIIHWSNLGEGHLQGRYLVHVQVPTPGGQYCLCKVCYAQSTQRERQTICGRC